MREASPSFDRIDRLLVCGATSRGGQMPNVVHRHAPNHQGLWPLHRVWGADDGRGRGGHCTDGEHEHGAMDKAVFLVLGPPWFCRGSPRQAIAGMVVASSQRSRTSAPASRRGRQTLRLRGNEAEIFSRWTASRDTSSGAIGRHRLACEKGGLDRQQEVLAAGRGWIKDEDG